MQCASSITSSPTEAANSGSMSSRKRGLFSRSGLISSRSTVPSASIRRTSAHSPWLVLLIVCARRPEPLGRRDLVAHQRQQRAHDQRRPGARLAQQRRRHEVHRRLAPARPLHAQHPRPVLDHVSDRLQLIRPELRLRAPRQRPQALQRGLGEGLRWGGGGHAVHPVRPETGLHVDIRTCYTSDHICVDSGSRAGRDCQRRKRLDCWVATPAARSARRGSRRDP